MNKPEFKGYPSMFVTDAEKATPSYGLQFARALYAQYVDNNTVYNERLSRIIRARKYAEGMQSAEKYKQQLGLVPSAPQDSGDAPTSYYNLDYTPPPILPKFLDTKLGQILNTRYKVLCTPINPLSKTQYDEDRRKMLANMFLKTSGAEEVEGETGVPVLPKDQFIPRDVEEAELYMQLNYKQAVSISAEEGIEFIFYNNNWRGIERELMRDLLTVKHCAVETYFDENYDIKIEYIDPADLVLPFSKLDDFRNIDRIAVMKKMTIQELAKEAPSLDDQVLYEIAKQAAAKYDNPQWNPNWGTSYYPLMDTFGRRPFDNFFVNVLKFQFLSVNKKKWSVVEKNGRTFFDRKGPDYEPPQDSKFKRDVINKKAVVRYEGCWVVGTEYVYNYGMAKNMTMPKVNGKYVPKTSLTIKVLSPNIYDMTNLSLVERMIPFADEIAKCHLKMQQIVSKVRPSGIAVDISGLEEIQKGMGEGKTKPTDIVEMYEQLGSYVFSSQRADGSTINGKPVDQISNEEGGKIRAIIEAYQYNINMIRDVTGINEVADASSPAPDALVGTSQIAIQQSNNATRELLLKYLDAMPKRIAEDVILKLQDSLENGKEISGYYESLGEQAVKTIQLGSKTALCEMGIKIELLPDDQDRLKLEAKIQRAQDTGELRVEDAIVIEEMAKSNVKKAAQLLILRKKKYLEEKILENQANIQATGEEQRASAEATERMKQETLMVEIKKELAVIEAKKKADIEVEDAKHKNKLEEIREQNKGKLEQVREQADQDFKNTALQGALKPSSNQQ